MSERMIISFFIRTIQLVLWVCLSTLILIPSSSLSAQDPDDVDDVEAVSYTHLTLPTILLV